MHTCINTYSDLLLLLLTLLTHTIIHTYIHTFITLPDTLQLMLTLTSHTYIHYLVRSCSLSHPHTHIHILPGAVMLILTHKAHLKALHIKQCHWRIHLVSFPNSYELAIHGRRHGTNMSCTVVLVCTRKSFSFCAGIHACTFHREHMLSGAVGTFHREHMLSGAGLLLGL